MVKIEKEGEPQIQSHLKNKCSGCLMHHDGMVALIGGGQTSIGKWVLLALPSLLFLYVSGMWSPKALQCTLTVILYNLYVKFQLFYVLIFKHYY